MVSRLSFRAKLLLVLFVPFLALVVVAAAGLSDRFTALRAQEQYGELSSPLHSLTEASRAVQNESVVSSWYVAGRGAPTAELAAARSRTDAAVKRFRADAQAFPDAGVSPAALAALTLADTSIDAIPTERVRVDSLSTDAAGAREFFLGVDDSLLGFGQRAARDLGDPDASASLTRVFALEQSQHELARQAGVYVAVLASGSATNFSEWVSAGAAAASDQDEFTNTATPAELKAYRSVFPAAAGADATTAAALPVAFPQTAEAPAAYYQQYQQQAAQLDRAIGSVQDVVHDAANASSAAALRDTRVYGGAAVFAMLLTLLLIWFVSRAVVGPVRRLTAAAREMSQHQLPALVESLRTGGDVSAIQPTRIEVTSEDEIGELAQAFNDVEAVTVEVAQEQARLLRKGMGDLFVNLARRNQSLLERQLELLDDLERNEHDPAALAALFKLDHMATRMRRNAESLLVLSGAEQPRQWQDPIALLDVVRAAAAEIADFPRVELVGIDEELAVSGRAVADVAHLIAELLENATSFSPPDSAVVVSGAVTSSGFVLAVSDQGIGMEPDRIAEANHLLADPPLVGLALSRALGLHVVGALAARHHITVELRPAALVGLVALVTLPQAVLERRVVPSPQPPVYAPEVAADGTPEPLGARRVAWRPSDEPPVEEWRRQGLGEPPAPPAPAPPSAPAPPRAPAPTNANAGINGNVNGNGAAAATAASMPPLVDEPPITLPPNGEPATEPLDADQEIPLATRVPGQHMSHQPSAGNEVADPEADPLRPYRVHELLTRHAQGKRRGRSQQDGAPGASGGPAGNPMDGSTNPWPGNGPGREDGR